MSLIIVFKCLLQVNINQLLIFLKIQLTSIAGMRPVDREFEPSNKGVTVLVAYAIRSWCDCNSLMPVSASKTVDFMQPCSSGWDAVQGSCYGSGSTKGHGQGWGETGGGRGRGSVPAKGIGPGCVRVGR